MVKMLGADTHNPIVESQGEVGGGGHVLRAVCDVSFSRSSEGSLEGGGFGGEGVAWPVEDRNCLVLIP